MTTDYVAEILRAAGTLRSGGPADVTAIVQNALALSGLTSPEPKVAGGGMTKPMQIQPMLPPYRNPSGHPSLRTDRLRKPLGEVIRTLRESGQGLNLTELPGLGGPLHGTRVPIPEGARFLDEQFSCAAGSRRYRLYVPASADQGLQGLIVMLHGCTQNPEDFAIGTGMNTLAEEHRLLVVYPAQTGGENAMSCWNWFRPGDQMRDAGEPAIIAGLTQSLRDRHDIPADRVFVAGLSAGGAMAVIMGETYPDLYGAIGVHSGLAYGSANDAMSAFAAMRGQAGIVPVSPRRHGHGAGAGPRVIVFHGSADTTVHPTNAERIIAGKVGSTGQTSRIEPDVTGATRGYTRLVVPREDGIHRIESWIIDGAPHAWSGGHPGGSYTDPRGPDASGAMVRFFLHGASDLTST